MDFLDLERERLKKAHTISTYTRRPESLKPIHGAISQYIREHSFYKTQDLNTSEYKFVSQKQMGDKKVDIALLDEHNALKGVIMFKGVCKDYNKNANNYYENMKGESSLFIEDNIPVYQMIWIPTYLPSSNSRGWEIPTDNHISNYKNFIKNKSAYWDLLQLDVFLFDVDYEHDYAIGYSQTLIVDSCSKTVEEGLDKFIKEVNNHWTR